VNCSDIVSYVFIGTFSLGSMTIILYFSNKNERDK
jgi:hypothetical protein